MRSHFAAVFLFLLVSTSFNGTCTLFRNSKKMYPWSKLGGCRINRIHSVAPESKSPQIHFLKKAALLLSASLESPAKNFTLSRQFFTWDRGLFTVKRRTLLWFAAAQKTTTNAYKCLWCERQLLCKTYGGNARTRKMKQEIATTRNARLVRKRTPY